MKIKPALFFIHRWLGIAMCLLFAMWFASGIVMMYVEYPELTEEERITQLTEIDLNQVRLNPLQAYQSTNFTQGFSQLRMSNVLGRPAYEFVSDEGIPAVVFADSGDLLTALDDNRAIEAVRTSGFYNAGLNPEYDGINEFDQWTLTTSLNSSRPLHRVNLNDDAGTVLYVSDKTGKIVRDTNRTEKMWNWLGSTVHWIYPAQLRKDVDLWIQVIIYISLIGIVSVVTGGIIGFMRIRIRHPYRGKNYSPYHGIMKLHHVLGLVSLVFVATFIFSGLMSMGPWGIFESDFSQEEQIDRFTGFSQLSLEQLPDVRELDMQIPIKEIRWHSIDAEPLMVLVHSSNNISTQFSKVSPHNQSPVFIEKIAATIPKFIPDSNLLSMDMIQSYDDYYYSRHNRYRPLPVYRAQFDDQEQTWFHVDLNTGEVVNRLTSATRLERWIYYGLHSLDFQILFSKRPLWDIVVIILSLIGLAFSITSIVIGWRSLVI